MVGTSTPAAPPAVRLSHTAHTNRALPSTLLNEQHAARCVVCNTQRRDLPPAAGLRFDKAEQDAIYQDELMGQALAQQEGSDFVGKFLK